MFALIDLLNLTDKITTELFSFTDSLLGSGSEDEDEDEHIRPPLGLNSLLNGPDSGGALTASDLSVQSMSTDSKTGHDDSDQVCILPFIFT